jgi:hypothetical protein
VLKRGHDVLVVDDLLADVHRWPVQVESLLDRDHGPIDASAVPAGGRQQDAAGGHLVIGHLPIVGEGTKSIGASAVS